MAVAEVTASAATVVATPRTDRSQEMHQGMPGLVGWVTRSAIPSPIFLAGTERTLARSRRVVRRLWSARSSRSRIQVSFSHCITAQETRSFSSSHSQFLATGDLVSADAQRSDFQQTASFSGTASIVSTVHTISPIHFSLGFPRRAGTTGPPGPEMPRRDRLMRRCRLRRSSPTARTQTVPASVREMKRRTAQSASRL